MENTLETVDTKEFLVYILGMIKAKENRND